MIPGTKPEALESAENDFARAVNDLDEYRDPVAALEELTSWRESVDSLTVALVQRCRDRGHTWQIIADALGVTPQAAHKRYNEEVTPTP